MAMAMADKEEEEAVEEPVPAVIAADMADMAAAAEVEGMVRQE